MQGFRTVSGAAWTDEGGGVVRKSSRFYFVLYVVSSWGGASLVGLRSFGCVVGRRYPRPRRRFIFIPQSRPGAEVRAAGKGGDNVPEKDEPQLPTSRLSAFGRQSVRPRRTPTRPRLRLSPSGQPSEYRGRRTSPSPTINNWMRELSLICTSQKAVSATPTNVGNRYGATPVQVVGPCLDATPGASGVGPLGRRL